MTVIVEQHPITLHYIYGVESTITSNLRGSEQHWQEIDVSDFAETIYQNPNYKVTVESESVVGGFQVIHTIWEPAE